MAPSRPRPALLGKDFSSPARASEEKRGAKNRMGDGWGHGRGQKNHRGRRSGEHGSGSAPGLMGEPGPWWTRSINRTGGRPKHSGRDDVCRGTRQNGQALGKGARHPHYIGRRPTFRGGVFWGHRIRRAYCMDIGAGDKGRVVSRFFASGHRSVRGNGRRGGQGAIYRSHRAGATSEGGSGSPHRGQGGYNIPRQGVARGGRTGATSVTQDGFPNAHSKWGTLMQGGGGLDAERFFFSRYPLK